MEMFIRKHYLIFKVQENKNNWTTLATNNRTNKNTYVNNLKVQ